MLTMSEVIVQNVRAFDVKYMAWTEFRDVLCSRDAPVKNADAWKTILSMDCILGGIDYTIEHR